MEREARLTPYPNPLSHRDYLRVARRGEGVKAERNGYQIFTRWLSGRHIGCPGFTPNAS